MERVRQKEQQQMELEARKREAIEQMTSAYAQHKMQQQIHGVPPPSLPSYQSLTPEMSADQQQFLAQVKSEAFAKMHQQQQQQPGGGVKQESPDSASELFPNYRLSECGSSSSSRG